MEYKEFLENKIVIAELNPESYDDGLFYLKSIEYKINVPTLTYNYCQVNIINILKEIIILIKCILKNG